MDNVPSIFKSKRFWSAVLGLVFMLAVEFVPQVGQNADELQAATMIVISLLIGGYSIQDTASAWHGTNKYNGDGQNTSA